LIVALLALEMGLLCGYWFGLFSAITGHLN